MYSKGDHMPGCSIKIEDAQYTQRYYVHSFQDRNLFKCMSSTSSDIQSNGLHLGMTEIKNTDRY